MLVKPIDLLESGRLRKEQLHSILYNDFVADPIGTAESIYRHFGRPFTDAARSSLRDYTVRHPRTSRPPHRYDTGDQAVISQERQAFRRYQEFFGVPSEV
jgi:hypothetical protein